MRVALAAVALAVAALALALWSYAPALEAPFYMDDYSSILFADAVHMEEVSVESVTRALTQGDLRGRPIANLSFALDHRFSGLDPRAFHATNVAIHALTAAALAWFAWLLATHAPRRRRSGSGVPPVLCALVVATLFAVHPLTTQAVTYAMQRMTSLAALFVVASLAAWIAARRSEGARRIALFAASGAAALLGLGSKEIAFMGPPVIALYEACFHREAWLERARAARERLRWRPVLIGAGLLLAAIVVLGFPWLQYAWETFPWYTIPERSYGPIERMLTQTRVVFFYVSLWLWPDPARLSLEHPFTISTGLLSPPVTLLATLGWITIAAAAALLAARWPRYGFPALAFLAFHAIESGPLPLELIYEHRFYLPMTMLFALLAVALADVPLRAGVAACVALLGLAAPLAGATHARNVVWSDKLEFQADRVAKAPQSGRAWYELGTELGRRGRFEEAVTALERSVALNPAAISVTQLGTAHLALGRRAQAARLYQQALRLDPDHADALYNLALMHDKAGRIEQALPLYRRFLAHADHGLREAAAWVEERVRLAEAGGPLPPP